MLERWDGINDPYEKTFEWILSPEVVRRPLLPAVVGSSLQPDADYDAYSTQPGTHLSSSGSENQLQQRTSNPFLEWLISDGAPIFWISGKAASGKSTLMKYLHKRPELATILSDKYANGSKNLIMASFSFYDQGKSKLQKSREGLLRALLHCLLKDREAMWREVFD